jgi:toxin ParE1/3/4
MPNVRYSKRAERDLEEIAAFTFEKWGDEQARRYVGGLYRICRLIAEKPLLGRLTVANRPTWRRLEHESHVILYSVTRSGITVQRIIHKDRLLASVVR